MFYSLHWFIQFQLNPYENCIDHPNSDVTDSHYLCEPFGFELKKGTLENKDYNLKRRYSKPGN